MLSSWWGCWLSSLPEQGCRMSYVDAQASWLGKTEGYVQQFSWIFFNIFFHFCLRFYKFYFHSSLGIHSVVHICPYIFLYFCFISNFFNIFFSCDLLVLYLLDVIISFLIFSVKICAILKAHSFLIFLISFSQFSFTLLTNVPSGFFINWYVIMLILIIFLVNDFIWFTLYWLQYFNVVEFLRLLGKCSCRELLGLRISFLLLCETLKTWPLRSFFYRYKLEIFSVFSCMLQCSAT